MSRITLERPGLHVLLVEDDTGDRRLIVETLGALPDVVLACTGTVAETVRKLQDKRPDVVLLDLGLPDSVGVGTFQRVRAAAPDVPVVVLSGDTDDGRALEAVAAGAEDFLVKGSTDAHTLRRLLRHAIERRTLTNRLATHLRQRDGLLELGQLALTGASQEELLTVAVQVVTKALGIEHGLVAQLDHQGELWVRASAGWHLDASRDRPLPTSPDGLARTALLGSTPVVISDLSRCRSVHDPILEQLGVVSAMAVAIPNGDAPWGVLGACSTTARAFSVHDTEFLTAAAAAISTANRRSSAERELAERLKEMRALIGVQRAVQDRSTSVETIGPVVVYEVRRGLAEVAELLVELSIGEATWRSGNARSEGRRLYAEVFADDQPRGRLTVYHSDEQPFQFPHEQDLLDGVAETLGLWLERQDSARALRDRERQLSFLLSQVPGSVWTTDTDMRFTRSVGRGLARLGVGPDEVVGRTVAEFLGPAGAQAVAAHARALAGERVAYHFAGHGSWQAFVEPLRDDDGATTGVIGIALDHTDLAIAQSEAAESRRRLQGLFDGALEGFLLVDDDGRYIDVNPAFCELTGHPRDVLLEQRLGFISPDPEPIRSLFGQMRRDGSVATTYVIVTADGSCRDIDLRGVANIARGLHLFTLRDVTERQRAEVALRASEARLRFLMEQLPGIVWFVDRDLKVLSHTGRGHGVIGVEPDSLIGWHAPDYMGPDSPGVAAAKRALEGVSTLYEEFFLDRWWETHASPVRDDEGTIIGAVGVGLDVTETKQAHAELEESRKRLQGLFDYAMDAIFLIDIEGRLIDANPAAATLLGSPKDEIVGSVGEHLVLDWGALVDEHIEGEYQLRRPDGTQVEVEYRAVANIVPGVHLVTSRDVTERRRAEARLRESEERFRRLAENAQDVIFRVRLGATPRFEYMSPAVEQMVGRSPQEFYDDPGLAVRLIHPDDRQTYRRLVGEPGNGNQLTVRWQRRDGTYRWVEERHTFVHDEDGNAIASEGVVRDVTDRVRGEEALRAALVREQEASEHLRRLDSAKNAFLTAVSHELRTPLTSILGFAAVLESRGESLGDDGRRDMAERILGNAQRLERLLTDLLDLDRMSHGTRNLRRTSTDIGVLVRRVVETIDVSEHPVRLEGGEFEACIDVAQVERIVEHLVHNATRHTPPQTPIWVRWSQTDTGLLIRVDDAGPGVPPDLRDRIFDRFQHGDSEAAKVGGTGIGLSLVRDFAAMHGGRAWVEERPGGGASFRVLLPYETLPSTAGAMVA